LFAGFAVTALLLALIGIYGVISLNVGSRTNEFGLSGWPLAPRQLMY